MSNKDQYRRHATEAQTMADRADNEEDRASWLRIATSWLNLLRRSGADRTAQEVFDKEVSEKGSGQDENKSSN